MKFLATLILPLLLATGNPPADIIRWSEGRKLTYADFKAAVPASTPWAATTRSSISLSYEFTGTTLVSLSVYASFEPQHSWMKVQTGEVLLHEQLHFDITEYFTRRFYLEVRRLEIRSLTKNDLVELFQQINSECGAFQKQYDGETSHGTIKAKQEEWQRKISGLLENTPACPSP